VSLDRDLIAVMGVSDVVETLSQLMMLFRTIFEESRVSRAHSSPGLGERIRGDDLLLFTFTSQSSFTPGLNWLLHRFAYNHSSAYSLFWTRSCSDAQLLACFQALIPKRRDAAGCAC